MRIALVCCEMNVLSVPATITLYFLLAAEQVSLNVNLWLVCQQVATREAQQVQVLN
jgi:hypothetical protein